MAQMKTKYRILYFLRETAIVVIGVLIAVTIGNYKENSDNENYIKKTLLAIEEEIILSQEEVDTVLKRHLNLLEAIEEETENDEQSLGDLIGNLGGFQVATIKNISLRFFVSNKAELLEFQLISRLLDIEFLSDFLSKKIDKLLDFVIDNINNKESEVKLKFAFLLAEVIETEQQLLSSYAEFLSTYKKDLKSPDVEVE